jgi:hypothetical protein
LTQGFDARLGGFNYLHYYSTVNEIVVECESDPEIAVTVMEEVSVVVDMVA